MAPDTNFDSLCSVVILGELSVGKSALCRNFFSKNQSQDPRSKPNMKKFEDFFEESQDDSEQDHHVFELPISVDGSNSRIRILDVNTERQILESACADLVGDLQQYLVAGDGYIVAYAVTDKGTFRTARNILKKIEEIEPIGDFPIILVGNKCDLVRKRQVSLNDGIKLAEKFQVKFIETSATLNQNVDQLFKGIITQIRLRELERQTEPKNGLKPPENGHPSLVKSRSYPGSLTTNEIASSSEVTNRKQCDVATKKKSGLVERCLRKVMKKKTDCVKSCQDFSLL